MLLDKLQAQTGRRELPAWWRGLKEREMPLGPYMIHSVVRIIGDWLNPKTGKFERRARGTGFYVRVPSESRPECWYTYIVTAHHVIDGQPKPELVFPDPYTPGGLYPPQETEGPDWMQPLADVDLAVLPYGRPDGFFVNALELGRHIRPELPPQTVLAMPFHYVGLLEPLNRAMARSGTLGALYEQGIEHKDGYEYVCHLGDCRSYRGFSGSPCFIEYQMASLQEADPPASQAEGEQAIGPVGKIRYLHRLCGMVTWHLEPPEGSPEDGPEASIFGVVVILPSEYIYKALMSDELVKARREGDEAPDEPEAVPKNLTTEQGLMPPLGIHRPEM